MAFFKIVLCMVRMTIDPAGAGNGPNHLILLDVKLRHQGDLLHIKVPNLMSSSISFVKANQIPCPFFTHKFNVKHFQMSSLMLEVRNLKSTKSRVALSDAFYIQVELYFEFNIFVL